MRRISFSNTPQVLGLVSMTAGDAALAGQRLETHRIDPAAPVLRDRDHLEAEHGGGGGVGAMGGIRHQHALPVRIRRAARVERGADRHHPAKLAMRAGAGRQRHAGHACQHRQPALEFAAERQRTLHRALRLERVDVRKARQPRNPLVQPRIVLHGAGAEREEAGVDAVILLRETRVVAHDRRLGEARQADGFGARKPAQPVRALRLRPVHADRAGAVLLEDQRLLDPEPEIAGDRVVGNRGS